MAKRSNRTLSQLLDKAKAARASTAAAERELDTMRARTASGGLVTDEQMAAAVLNAEIARVREELAREALQSSVDTAHLSLGAL